MSFYERYVYYFFFFKQKTAYEMRISDWSSDVCSSDLEAPERAADAEEGEAGGRDEEGHYGGEPVLGRRQRLGQRGAEGAQQGEARHRQDQVGRNRGNEGGDGPRQQSEHDIGKATDNGGPVTPARIGLRDRKSTRLNSS